MTDDQGFQQAVPPLDRDHLLNMLASERRVSGEYPSVVRRLSLWRCDEAVVSAALWLTVIQSEDDPSASWRQVSEAELLSCVGDRAFRLIRTWPRSDRAELFASVSAGGEPMVHPAGLDLMKTGDLEDHAHLVLAFALEDRGDDGRLSPVYRHLAPVVNAQALVALESATDDPDFAYRECVGDPAAFADEYWGKHVLLTRGSTLGDLLTIDDVEHLIENELLRISDFRVIRGQRPVSPGEYLRQQPRAHGGPGTGQVDPASAASRLMNGRVDSRKLSALMGSGATVVLQSLESYHARVRDLVVMMSSALGHPCQVNAYITPANAQGLPTHSDPHDVFVIQQAGSKSWRVGRTPYEELRGEAGSGDFSLAPGDVQYMPRGTPHAAIAGGDVSVHLTVGVLAVSVSDVLRSGLRVLQERDPRLGEALPPGWQSSPETFRLAAEAAFEALGVGRGESTGAAWSGMGYWRDESEPGTRFPLDPRRDRRGGPDGGKP